MLPSTKKAATSVGFLAILETDTHGIFGGYLVVDTQGRPLEFHCTTPVKPNRAQEILYGPTLLPYLYGEQIAGALVAKAKLKPQAILVDAAPTLAVREHVELPVGLLLKEDDTEGAKLLASFELKNHRLATAIDYSADQGPLAAALEPMLQRLDLNEPFGRIHDAIREAGRAA